MPCHVEGPPAFDGSLLKYAILGISLAFVNPAQSGVIGHMADVSDVLDQANLDLAELGGATNKVC
ncbi:unannotated protein [freshwater metagenome]|uniref:Unannotated protein n=1 Tax=freshwater metagenome TaxID=449393 RepID=A0A6J7E3L2_9ZZZZ